MGILAAILAVVALVAAFAGLLVLASAVRAFVLAKLWLWFVVPTFGVAALPLTVAFGLSLLASYATGHNTQLVKDEYRDKKLERLNILTPLIVLLVGYVAKTFFM